MENWKRILLKSAGFDRSFAVVAAVIPGNRTVVVRKTSKADDMRLKQHQSRNRQQKAR